MTTNLMYIELAFCLVIVLLMRFSIYLYISMNKLDAGLKPGWSKTYTQDEVEKLILEEREKCASIADEYAMHTTANTNYKINELAQAIRRGKFVMGKQ